MRFKGRERTGFWPLQGSPSQTTAAMLLLFTCLLACCFIILFSAAACAGVIDRVVAFVDQRPITLQEFREVYGKQKSMRADVSPEEVLAMIINRILLLREAKSLKIESRTDEELIKEYIELKVKAFIRFREDDLQEFYRANQPEFKETPYEEVRDKIEEYLTEKEINRLLKKHVEDLRTKAYIKRVFEGPLP